MSRVAKATVNMLKTYHELNGDIECLDEEPSPLAFMRYVARNRPLVVRQGCSKWHAIRKWNADYLKGIMKDMPVKVAITPHGNADSAVTNPKDRLTYFVKPFELDEPFSVFISDLQSSNARKKAHPIKYSQARGPPLGFETVPANSLFPENDNFRGEYAVLYQDVEADIRWASIALQKKPEAINLWIGNKHSITALHRDNYENVYCQVVGSKDFVLLAPVETACINEKFLPSATYAADMSIVPDDPPAQIPHAVWDPDRPEENSTRFSSLSRPLRIRLNPGDMLYLPACWYHKVSQNTSDEGLCCSVNYWYDMDFEGSFYASNVFIRDMAWTST